MSERLPPSGPSPSPVDDGRSQVAGAPRRELSTGTKLGLGALIGMLALGFIWLNAFYSHEGNKPRSQQAAYMNGGEQFAPPPPVAAKPVPVAMPLPAPAPATTPFMGTNQASPAAAPILAYSGQETAVPPPSPAAATPSQAGSGVGTGGAAAGGLAPDTSPLAARLKPTVLDGEQASVLQNPDMVITEGTIVPCILQTAIDSQLPSLVTCVVPMDIRGSTGNVVLLDAGTKIVGQMESGLLQGQNRVFVDWTRAETPDHVIVTLDSPGTDQLGRGGLAGAVNNHFWDRFGGALMLTLVQGALQAGTVAAAGNGS